MSARGLGIDVGGTQTRWALTDADGQITATGAVRGGSALQFVDPWGRATLDAALTELKAAVDVHPKADRVVAGMTGFAGSIDAAALEIKALFHNTLGIAPSSVVLLGDVELAYLSAFAPGTGYLVYAGTGSIAMYISKEGNVSRAGGRGHLLDDGGSGFWIAREAFRRIWRDRDASPGSWRESALASRVYDYIGGSDWLTTREFVYSKSRGEVGEVALLVAETAGADVRSTQILMDAGAELARLSNVMSKRFGRKPTALAGRVVDLHELIERSFRASLSYQSKVRIFRGATHVTAARLAAAGFDRAPSGAILGDNWDAIRSPPADESDED